MYADQTVTSLRSKFTEGDVVVCTVDPNTRDWKLKERELLHEKEKKKKLKSQQKTDF
jgi:hypothetical protein